MERVLERELHVAATWDGRSLEPDETARVRFRLSPGVLDVWVEAPDHGDPPPPAPPVGPSGSTPRLWEYEVVELFLVGPKQRYLEIELGPRGHHLALLLRGPRRVERTGLPLTYAVDPPRDGRWRGHARIDAALVPTPLRAMNAFAIHGVGSARRHLAAAPTGGEVPDFHRLERFLPVGPGG